MWCLQFRLTNLALEKAAALPVVYRSCLRLLRLWIALSMKSCKTSQIHIDFLRVRATLYHTPSQILNQVGMYSARCEGSYALVNRLSRTATLPGRLVNLSEIMRVQPEQRRLRPSTTTDGRSQKTRQVVHYSLTSHCSHSFSHVFAICTRIALFIKN